MTEVAFSNGTHESDPIKSPSSKGPDKKNTPEKDGPKKTSWTNLSHENMCGKWSLRVTRDKNKQGLNCGKYTTYCKNMSSQK